jgi:hypothetical protein
MDRHSLIPDLKQARTLGYTAQGQLLFQSTHKVNEHHCDCPNFPSTTNVRLKGVPMKTVLLLVMLLALAALGTAQVMPPSRELSVPSPDTLGLMIYMPLMTEIDGVDFQKQVMQDISSRLNKAGIAVVVAFGPVPPRIPCIRLIINIFPPNDVAGVTKHQFCGSVDFIRLCQFETKEGFVSTITPVNYQVLCGHEDDVFSILGEVRSKVDGLVIEFLAAN